MKTFVKTWFALLVLSCPGYSGDLDCRICHRSVFLKQRNLSAIANGMYPGHPWIQPGSRTVPKTEKQDSFYTKLMTLNLQISAANEKVVRSTLQGLVQQGREEVPKFEKVWKIGKTLLSEELDFKQVSNYLNLLFNPFLHLFFSKNQTIRYQAESSLDVGKVLLLFGGYHNKATTDFHFSSMDWTGRGYGGIFQSKTLSKSRAIHSTSQVQLSSKGGLEGFKLRQGIANPGVLNLAGFLQRSHAGKDFGFRDRKTIYLGKHPGLSFDQVEMDLAFQIQELRIDANRNPVLDLLFSLKQAPSKNRNFFCQGKGKLVLGLDGLVKELESKTHFTVRFLGIPFVKGISRDIIRMKPN